MRATWRLRQPVRLIVLRFPNSCRFFDATRRAVRFWASDSAMEVSFFVEEGALRRMDPAVEIDEVGFLTIFDLNRDLIHAAAARVYQRGRRGSYDLTPADF